ncbi:MAG: hypothetical protein IPN90_12465 [Elusimicrobia bacterium]|nr:hypothetical protein [Elusimicrobiota bacterium]
MPRPFGQWETIRTWLYVDRAHKNYLIHSRTPRFIHRVGDFDGDGIHDFVLVTREDLNRRSMKLMLFGTIG